MLANLGSMNEQYRNHGRQWLDLGSFLAGGLGAPSLSVTGNCMPETHVNFVVNGVPNDSAAYLLIGTKISYDSFFGGILVVDPSEILRVFSAENTGSDNQVNFHAFVPKTGLVPEMRLVFQAWIVDEDAPFGYSATNGLRVITP